MCNELGITRQDIEAWTKQAAANEIEKKLHDIDIAKIASDAITKAAREAVGVNNRFSQEGAALREALAKELAKGLTITTTTTTA